MSRLDRQGLLDAVAAKLSAQPDPEGKADLVGSQGHINVAASAADIAPAIDRLKSLDGYRWIAINADDLFFASPRTIGTKVGIVDASGRVLKNADLPRKRD